MATKNAIRLWIVMALVGVLPDGGGSAQETERVPLTLQGVRILLAAEYWDVMSIPAVSRLKQTGATVTKGDLETLTWDAVRQHHLILVAGTPTMGSKTREALERFGRAGGGLLVLAPHGDMPNNLLESIGATMLAEYVLDPAHVFQTPTGFRLTYAYTDKITADHPVTQGVKGLWYSVNDYWEQPFGTRPLQLSADWRVLATGMPEAFTQIRGGRAEEHIRKPGQYASAPPLVAAREWGAGRVVVMGMTATEMFYGQGLPAYRNVTLERGDGVRPSDLRRLYENALRWLAEQAKRAEELGQSELPQAKPDFAGQKSPDWNGDVFGADQWPQPLRGVIGAQSSLSEGKATPEALINQAKAVGLKWLAFTERLEKLTPEEWKILRRLCAEASTAEFCALPGLDYADQAGARYVVFGDFDWPPEKVFSEDKKRIIEPTWWFGIGCLPNGPCNVKTSPLNFWDYSLYNGFAVRTTIDGRQEEALEEYRYMQGVEDDLYPMAVDFVKTETELAAAAGRMCSYACVSSPEELVNHLRRRSGGPLFRGFASDGPVVTEWEIHNGTRDTGGRWWQPGSEQYRVKLSVRSAAPVTDIRIYDGPTLFRRFAPNQEHVTLTFDGPHDQQHNLCAEITDAQGKRAITGRVWVRDLLMFRFSCGDRQNAICDGVFVDEGGVFLTGPTAPYQLKMVARPIFPGYGERHFAVLPPNLDGGMRPVAMGVAPWIHGYGPSGAGGLETRMDIPLSSRDGISQGNTITGTYDTFASPGTPKSPARPVDEVTVHYRYTMITPRLHDPGVVLLEGSFRFRKPMQVPGMTVFQVGHLSEPGWGDHFALVTPEKSLVGMPGTTNLAVSSPMAPGSYMCVFPSLWGSSGAMALDEGYGAHLSTQGQTIRMQVHLGDMPRKVQAGEEIAYRLLLVQGSLQEQPNNADWERLAVTMGLRGKPAYDVTAVKAGQVAGTKFLLELAPTEGAFLGTVSQADLPLRLPVRVADMNPNWTFGWFDLDRKAWYPCAVDPQTGKGFFTVDTREGAHRVLAGHPVLASDPKVRIAAFTDAKSAVWAELNNVSETPVTVTVRLNPAWGEAPPQTVALAPGSLARVTFAWTPK